MLGESLREWIPATLRDGTSASRSHWTGYCSEGMGKLRTKRRAPHTLPILWVYRGMGPTHRQWCQKYLKMKVPQVGRALPMADGVIQTRCVKHHRMVSASGSRHHATCHHHSRCLCGKGQRGGQGSSLGRSRNLLLGGCSRFWFWMKYVEWVKKCRV